MIKRLTGIALGLLLFTVASAQSLEERVRQLEERVNQLERQQMRAASPSPSPKPVINQAEGWRQRENWRALKRGMTDSDVRSLLGEPTKVNAYGFFSVWEYPEAGRAQFDRAEKLNGWAEPR
ncbi:hypothetical protein [Variovorax sp. HJSM1_2]|uniref:hypothetical protein n=1 Tax=Variovorax sp. HJSM1_2 TaxID=3366263 RepID=UPI003BCCE515